MVVGSIDFGDECLLYGRPGRDFGDRDASFRLVGNLFRPGAQAFGDVVTLRLALIRWFEIDLNISLIGSAAEIVVADKPVEVERGGGARVNLKVGDVGSGLLTFMKLDSINTISPYSDIVFMERNACGRSCLIRTSMWQSK